VSSTIEPLTVMSLFAPTSSMAAMMLWALLARTTLGLFAQQ
jgi:hypothetical protein